MGKCSEKVLRNLQRDCDGERTVYIGKYSQNHMAPTKYLSSLRRKSVQVLGLMPNRFTITMHAIKKSTASLSPFLSILAYSAILWRSVCMFHLQLFQLTGWGERDTHRYQLHFSFQHSLK